MGSAERDKNRTIATSLMLDREQLAEVKEIAKREQRSLSAQVRVLIAKALKEAA